MCGSEYFKSGKTFNTKFCSECRAKIKNKSKESIKICQECGVRYDHKNPGASIKFCSDNRRKTRAKRNSTLMRQHQKDKLNNLIKFKDEILNTAFNRYRLSAIKRGFVFELTHKEFNAFFQDKCYYCGDKIKVIGIDRKDSNIGYLLSNCVPCCTFCNLMKRNHTESVFIQKCNQIANNTKTKTTF